MERKVSAKPSLSVATDALQEQGRSCKDRSATSGLLLLCSSAGGHQLSSRSSALFPIPQTRLTWGIPSAFAPWLPREASRADKALCVTRSLLTRGKDCGRNEASLQEKVTTKPGGNASGREGTRQVSNHGVPLACAAPSPTGSTLCRKLAAPPGF